MMIGTISAPVTAPQLFMPPPKAQNVYVNSNPLDAAILEGLPNQGAVKIWDLLNRLAADQEPRTRREYRLRLLERLKWLLQNGLIFRWGRAEVASERRAPGATPIRMRKSRSNSCVANRPVEQPSSTHQVPKEPLTHSGVQRVDEQLIGVHSAKGTEPAKETKTESALSPCRNEISDAARVLAKVPRRGRKWTGYLDPADPRTRMWRDRPIVLPDGSEAYIYGVRSGLVIWTRDIGRIVDILDINHLRWGVIAAHLVRPQKHPAAVALGRFKAGVEERPSEAKARAARINGKRPCRAGKRRGRPRRQFD